MDWNTLTRPEIAGIGVCCLQLAALILVSRIPAPKKVKRRAPPARTQETPRLYPLTQG